MPRLTWSQSIGAGAIFRPLDGWQYQYVPMGGQIEILDRAVAIGVVSNVSSGSDTLQERSPVPSGGTAGVIPSAFDVPALVDDVAGGDLIKIQYENTTLAAITVDGVIDYKPV